MLNGLKRFFGFSPLKWIGATQLKEQALGLKNMMYAFLTPKKAQRVETFQEAMERLGLSENDLQQRKTEFSFLVKFFSFIGLLVVAYTIYLIFHHAWLAMLGMLGILLIIASQIFRYHFWLFQIQHRKLGCSLREWLTGFRSKK